MGVPNLSITKQQGIGRRTPGADSISGLICGGVATDDVAIGDIIELKSPLDAVAKGITPQYDSDNSILLYSRIKRFFFRNPSATLHLMMVERGTTLTQMCDKDNNYLKKLLNDLNGDIKQVGVALNPEDDYVGVYNAGIDADVLTAVVKAQALATEQWNSDGPLVIYIEGYHFNGTATDAPDLRELDSENVRVVIAADPVFSGQGGAKEFYAAVEDVLGYVSLAKVNESIGWVGKFPLQDLDEEAFVTAGLSSGLPITSYTSTGPNNDLDTLHDKGYIIPVRHRNKVGYYFNGAPTCTAISHDENYCERSRTLNKAKRTIRVALIDDLSAPLPLNDDGTIRADVIGDLEAKAEKGLNDMKKAGEISAFDVYIDPTQKPLLPAEGEEEGTDMDFMIVPVGVNRQIRGKLKLVSAV